MTDDDVKTRAQKELLSEITRPEATEQSTHGNQMEQQQAGEEVPQEGEEDKEKPKVARKGTMVATAEVCVCVCYGEEPGLCECVLCGEPKLCVCVCYGEDQGCGCVCVLCGEPMLSR